MEASKLQINYKELLFKISSFPEETTRQLLEYIDFLWERHSPAVDGLSELDKNELDKRVKKYFQNPETGFSLSQVISRLEKDLGEKLSQSMHQAIFTAEANQELREAILWFENQQKGVGKNLANEVIDNVRKLEAKPDAYSSDDKGLRKTGLKSFPYFIYYLFKSPIVLIIAVWHKSRLTDAVEERASKIIVDKDES